MQHASTPITDVERWRRALDLAYAKGTHRRMATFEGSGMLLAAAFVGTKGERYDTTMASCTCRAGAFGRPCTHRAALADAGGMMDVFVPGIYDEEAKLA